MSGSHERELLYLLPDDRDRLVLDLLHDLAATRRRLRLCTFLPPCGRLARALEAVAAKLPPGAAQAVVDGTTQASLGRFDVPWAERRVLPDAGTLHAKVLICDDVLWWGSWNFSLTATRQLDMVERTMDPQRIAQVLRWLDTVRERTELVELGSAPRGAYKPKDGTKDPRDVALRTDPTYDSDLGW